MRVLKAEYKFRELKIRIYEEDFLHAKENHPYVSLDKIKNCIENPDKVIVSIRGKNGCLFYKKQNRNDYFVVVIHTVELLIGEVRTAYNASYMKSGRIL